MPPKRANPETKGVKKNRKAISLANKLDILRRLDAGEKLGEIARMLKLAPSTIATIRNNKTKILAHSQSAASQMATKLTRYRSAIMEKMEKLLILWIEDNNQRKIPMSTMTIQEKAKTIFETLRKADEEGIFQNESFGASKGWFEKFKTRHNLHNIKMKGEAASSDTSAAREYPNVLKKIIEAGGYVPEQVFNVDESGLYWKRMPDRTFISTAENSIPGFKVAKERLTLLLGCNASGDFKLKPLLIYQSENPRALKGYDKSFLPVIWRSNKKAWMTSSIFEDWFKKCFCPSVKSYLQQKNLDNKALLLLDNAPGHPVNLCDLSGNVRVEYLPKNTTALIQPMDQGAISTFKAYYLRRTFKKLIDETDGHRNVSIKEFWKSYNIKDAVDNIGKAWDEMKPSTLKAVWKNIWPDIINEDDFQSQNLTEVVENIVSLGNQLGFEDLAESDVTELLKAHGGSLSDEDLLALEQNQLSEEQQTENNVEDTHQRLTTKRLSQALSCFEEGLRIINENDPVEERSMKVSRGVNEAIDCYKQIYEEKQKMATQPTLDLFFSPIASTSVTSNNKTHKNSESDVDFYVDLNSNTSS